MSQRPGNELVKMTVDGDLVRAVVEKQVTAAISAEFNKVPDLIEKVVSAALRMKVTSEGGVSQYSSDNRYDFVEVLCHKAIRECATETVKDWILKNQPLVKKAVEKHLNSQKSDFVKRFVEAVDGAISPAFYVNCTLKLKSDPPHYKPPHPWPLRQRGSVAARREDQPPSEATVLQTEENQPTKTMSYCQIITFQNGQPKRGPEFGNAWGGAARIWNALFERYISKRHEYDNWLGNDSRLWDLARDERVPFNERLVHVSTFDLTYVARANFQEYVQALHDFVAKYPSGACVDHLPAWADFISKSDSEAIGFYDTSVGENLWFPFDSEADEEHPVPLIKGVNAFDWLKSLEHKTIKPIIAA